MDFTLVFLSVVVGILLCTSYSTYKLAALITGCVVWMFFSRNIGLALMYGALIAYVFYVVGMGWEWFANQCSVFFKQVISSDSKQDKYFEELIELIDSVDENDSDTILYAIHRLNEFDKDSLSFEQINILRQKTAELWKKYLKTGAHRKSNSSSSNSSGSSSSYTEYEDDLKSPYDILGVSPSASRDEIKRAYIKLCKKYHPDVNHDKDAESKFKEIQEAYEILTA